MGRSRANTCTPSLAAFARLAAQANVIPVCRTIRAAAETPLSAYLKLEGRGPAYLLESAEQGKGMGRYSFIGAAPSLVVESHGRRMTVTDRRGTRRWTMAHDPLWELQQLLAPYRSVTLPGLPRFAGGFVGYVGYDLVRFLEPVGPAKPDVLGVPDSVWMLSDTVVVFDHLERVLKIIVNAMIPSGTPATLGRRAGTAYARAAARIDEIIEQLQRPAPAARPSAPRRTRRPSAVRSNMTRPAFLAAVQRAKAAIAQGETIQIVLSQRFEVPVACRPFEIYRALRSVNPSPYMFYFHRGSFALVGSSPEILVRCEQGVVTVRPIAGTRPRGKTLADDRRIEADLRRDPKERAEHLMLVDLGRNDIGRVCDYGSVTVNDLMVVERYSHVMHLVSHVVGRLRQDKNAFDVLRATFPAGTVTGAPKVRAMQLINELEPDARGPYAGAVGYVSFTGNMDLCITIRTALVQGRRASVQAGAGIVADSQPAREYQETRNKAAGLLHAIELAERGMPA